MIVNLAFGNDFHASNYILSVPTAEFCPVPSISVFRDCNIQGNPNMSDDSEDVKTKLDKFKPKKKKLAVPKEFLEGANNYDEKLMVVRLFAEKNVQNTVRLFKNMLKDEIERKKKV